MGFDMRTDCCCERFKTSDLSLITKRRSLSNNYRETLESWETYAFFSCNVVLLTNQCEFFENFTGSFLTNGGAETSDLFSCTTILSIRVAKDFDAK